MLCFPYRSNSVAIEIEVSAGGYLDILLGGLQAELLHL